MNKDQTKERRCILADVHLEQRSAEEISRTISGYALKFDAWSEPLGYGNYRFLERINRHALDNSDATDTIATFNHNIDDIMARTSSGTLTLTVDEIGLKFSFEAPNTTRGNDLVELVHRGDVNKCSFIMEVSSETWTYADQENGKEYHERTIMGISKVWDIAMVVYPAYQDTEVSVRSLEKLKDEMEKRQQHMTEETEERNRQFQFITVQHNN